MPLAQASAPPRGCCTAMRSGPHFQAVGPCDPPLHLIAGGARRQGEQPFQREEELHPAKGAPGVQSWLQAPQPESHALPRPQKLAGLCPWAPDSSASRAFLPPPHAGCRLRLCCLGKQRSPWLAEAHIFTWWGTEGFQDAGWVPIPDNLRDGDPAHGSGRGAHGGCRESHIRSGGYSCDFIQLSYTLPPS